MRYLICIFVVTALFAQAPQPGSIILGSSATPSGAAGGDLTGTYPNPTIKSSVSLTTPNINVAIGTSLALGACTIGTNSLCAAGHLLVEGVTSTGATGTGAFVFATSPTLVTPVLGVATMTSLNKTAITAPSTAATITFNTDNATANLTNGTMAITGTDINTSGQVTATHLAAALPVAQGGTNCTSATITCFNNITGFSAAGTTGTTSTNLVFSGAPAFTGSATGVILTLTDASHQPLILGDGTRSYSFNVASGNVTNSTRDLVILGSASSTGFFFQPRNSGGTAVAGLAIDRDGNLCAQCTAPAVTGLTMGTSSNIQIPVQKSTTGVRYLCIDTAGNVASSAAACVGT